MQTWKLREEIYRSFHQWIYLAACAFIGAAAGWGLSFLWQSPFEAAAQIYVGLNAYRAYADAEFSALANQEYTNQDDYKNWQMAQLDELAVSGEMLDDTLERLRSDDSYWKGVSKSALRGMLRAEWRTAGKWSIIATHGEAKRASQASQAWSDAIVKRTNKYINAAQDMTFIDIQMQEAAQDAGTAQSRLAVLRRAAQLVKDYQQDLHKAPDDQPLNGLLRSQVLSLAGLLADYSPSWQALLSKQPAADARPEVYLDFLDQLTPLIANDKILMEARVKQRTDDYEELSTNYVRAAKESRGLAVNLDVEGLDPDLAPVVTRVRPLGIFILAGALLGMCVWILMQIVRISRKTGTNA